MHPLLFSIGCENQTLNVNGNLNYNEPCYKTTKHLSLIVTLQANFVYIYEYMYMYVINRTTVGVKAIIIDFCTHLSHLHKYN